MNAPEGQSREETGAAPPDSEVQTTTVLAVGGIVACTVLALRDPAARAHCHRIARDPRMRQWLADTVRRLGREAPPLLERWNG